MKTIRLTKKNLLEEGLTMEVEIMPSVEFIKRKHDSLHAIPRVTVQALFDTGAKVCAVDQSVIKELGVIPYQVTSVKTPFHTVQRETYQLIFKIPGEKEYFPVTAVAADFSQETCKAIIGRDFLQYCILVYDGTENASSIHLVK